MTASLSGSRTIRARIHENALGRVTRMYAATLAEAFTEVLQNARRAGAGAVRIVVLEDGRGGRSVRIEDDGCGIADPAVLLSFGENGWSEELVAREDAAGMGFLSLARHGCRISSRPVGGTGWTVALEPEHFSGECRASVLEDDTAPRPHGTAVEFKATERPDAILRAATVAAWFYPLPVTFVDAVSDTETVLEGRDFLAPADHVEDWRGLRFGVVRSAGAVGNHGAPDTNFHGLTLCLNLPAVATRASELPVWAVRAEIRDCPEIELVLPARREAVQTPFLDEVRAAARLAIYRAMSEADDPRPAFKDWKRARDAGIEIAPPSARLKPWVPDLADAWAWNHPNRELKPLGDDPLIVVWHGDPHEQQALARAAELAGIAGRLYDADPGLEGFDWYDRAARITGMVAELRREGRCWSLDEFPKTERPDAIALKLTVEEGGVGRTLDLPADVVFESEGWTGLDDVNPLVARESTLSTADLAVLLRNAFFCPSDDGDADSWERQSSDFDGDALAIACEVLLSADDALKVSIIDAIQRELLGRLPRDRICTIAILGREISVSLGPCPAEDGS